MLNKDYRDILQRLLDEKAKFLLVGTYALAAHGFPRATMAIDIWVMALPKNADAVLRALKRFGAPLHGLQKSDLLKEETVFQIGMAPRRIDIIAGATGLKFEEAFARSVEVIIDGLPVRVLSIEDMITNKKATGRTRDLADVEALAAMRNSTPPNLPDK